MEQTMDDMEVGDALTCDQCLEAGETLEAVGYCRDCAEFLCAYCFEYHHRPKPWKSHRLLTKEAMPCVKLSKNPTDTNKNETCPDHTGKAVEYCCETDKTLGCSVCMTIDHRLCEIIHLPNDSKHVLDMPACKVLRTDKETLKHNLHELATRTEGFKKQAEMIAEAAVKDVTAFRNELVKELDKCRNETIAHVEEMKNNDLKYLDNILKDSEQIEHALKEMETSLSKQKKNCHLGLMNVAVKQGSEAVLLRKQELDKLNTNNTGINPYTFQPSDKFLDLFRRETKNFGCFTIAKSLSESHAIKEEGGTDNTLETMDGMRSMPTETTDQKNEEPDLGDLSCEESTDFDDPFVDSMKSQVDTDGITTPCKLHGLPVCSSGTRITDINVRDGTDKHTCSITGMARMKSQKLALCDFQNSCVKLISTKNISESNCDIILKVKLKSPPYDAASSKNELAVTQPYVGKVCLMTFTFYNGVRVVKSLREFVVGAECRGIAYHGNYYVSFNTKPARIDVIDTSGRAVKTFSEVNGPSFHHPCHMTVTKFDRCLHVCDSRVVRISFSGRLIQKHCDIDFTELKGITVDREGNIYVCDWGQDKVYIIYKKAAIKQVFLDSRHGIVKPHSIFVDIRRKKMRKLFVGMDKSDVIKLYQDAWL